jgi:hypothetical protein
MGNVQLGRLLDTRLHDPESHLDAEDETAPGSSGLLPVLHDA